jgi:hypothetical protein
VNTDQYRAEIIGREVVDALAAQIDARFGPNATDAGVAGPHTSVARVRVIANDHEPDRATLVVDTFYVNAIALYVEAYCTGWRHARERNPAPDPDGGYGETPGDAPPGPNFPEEYPD